jgi:hypothetical protein
VLGAGKSSLAGAALSKAPRGNKSHEQLGVGVQYFLWIGRYVPRFAAREPGVGANPHWSDPFSKI